MHPAQPPSRSRPSPRSVQARVPVDVAAELPELPAGPAPARRPSPRAGLPFAATAEPVVGGVVHVDGEAIRVPGLAAALRRNPAHVRRGSVGAIGAGIALFVIAGIATPLAGADTAGRADSANASASPAIAFDPATLSFGAPEPAVKKSLARPPAHAKVPAPVDHGVISGLAANGIPKVALNAYRVAAARMANVEPGCGIDWALLAGIGREESDHGRFAGAQLHKDGTSTPEIVGPALDGVHWDFIPAPGNGAELDGDAKFAHALGPMQFIPSTWANYGVDATGDGKADIFNINDAALGAARYLCAAGGNLRTRAGQVAAVLAYNHSDQYLGQVLALADAYRRGVPITGLPVGITKGGLPQLADTGYIPPANPGAPTAADKKTRTTATKPKPAASTSTATKPTSGATSGTSSKAAPSPTASSSTAASSTAASSPTKTTSGSTTSTSSPTPTKSCTALEKLLHTNGC